MDSEFCCKLPCEAGEVVEMINCGDHLMILCENANYLFYPETHELFGPGVNRGNDTVH